VALTRQAGPADVAVWPENVVPAFLPANEALLTPALESLAETVRHVVLGAPRTSADANGAVYNAALLYSDARRVAAHDKVHPVPFAESIPAFSRGWWKRPIAVGAGDAPQTLPIPGAMLGPLICYELLFDELGVAQTRAGADVILNLSHDGYFGGSWGARQHLLAAPLRAIELGRPLLRATSSGITVAIDSAGRVAARAPAQTPATLRVDVWPGGRATLFARFGSWFARHGPRPFDCAKATLRAQRLSTGCRMLGAIAPNRERYACRRAQPGLTKPGRRMKERTRESVSGSRSTSPVSMSLQT
jgi:apolipoprotein N-acyltransferase